MRNHWLKERARKTSDFWTAEFVDWSSASLLRPRRVGVRDRTLGYLGQTSGHTELTFPDGMVAFNDDELSDLIRRARSSMFGWMACLRHVVGSDMVEYYDLSDLTFNAVAVGGEPTDIVLRFHYNDIRHVYVV